MDLKDQALEFMRGAVRDALAQCTPKQQAFFAKLYPQGIGKLTERKLSTAHDQCLRTIAKNQRAALSREEGGSR